MFIPNSYRPSILGAFVLIAAVVSTTAQSSLFNIPTTDILDRGSTYVEADLDAHFAPDPSDRWQSVGFMAVRGVSRRLEVGVNGYAVRAGQTFEPFEIQPTLKFRLYENESLGVSISTGAIGNLPFRRKFRENASVSFYAVASKQFAGGRSPRITGGGYQIIGSTPGSTASRGFLVGYEQPVMDRLSLIADWSTGKNRFGYAAAGFGLAVSKKSYLSSAYYFGNQGRGNNSFGIYYGLTF